MTAEGNTWYKTEIEFDASLEGYESFWFVSYMINDDRAFLGNLGVADRINPDEGFLYSTVFKSCPDNEIWIVSREENPPDLFCFNPLSNLLFIFNPWMSGNPNVNFNGTTSPTFKSSLCGWYALNIPDSLTSLEITISQSINGEIYGQAGLGDSNPIDLTPHFSQSDSVYLFPSPLPTLEGQAAGPPQLATEFPGILGQCQYILGFTVRDFSEQHPNFEPILGNQAPTPGMVLPELAADGKPQKDSSMNELSLGVQNSEFVSWFNTHSNTGIDSLNNFQTCVTLPFTKNWEGYWEYSSLNEPSRGFFPIDNFTYLPDGNPNPNLSEYESNYQPFKNGMFLTQFNRDPTGGLHNFHFCSELHAEFTYKPGHILFVGGDDDVWAFVNNRLTVDLGGTHLASQKEVSLDTLGLTEGEKYPLDVFQCERLTTSSNFVLRTSLILEPPTDINIGVSPEAVELGLPNCNIPDSSIVKINLPEKFENRTGKAKEQFFEFKNQQGYPKYYSREKDGYYSPKGGFTR